MIDAKQTDEMADYPAHYVRVDRIDLKILDALQADGRATNQRLAERVALSPSACLSRVRRLEQLGIITGYHARVAVELIRPTLTIYAEVTMKKHFAAGFAQFEAYIARIPEIVDASRVSGTFDYLMTVLVTDAREWRELALALLAEEHGVEKIQSHIMLAEAKPRVGMPVKMRSHARSR